MSSSAAAPARGRDAQAFTYAEGKQSAHAISQNPVAQIQPLGDSGTEAPRISETELSRLIAEAKAEGIRQGAQKAREELQQEIEKAKQKLSELVDDFERQRNEYFSKVETELVHFALAIAARILHREAAVDRMVVAGLVKIMLEKLEDGSQVKIHVRPEESSGWHHYFHERPQVQIIDDSSLDPHGCLVETQLGIADMGLDSQLKELENGFFDLLAQRPSPK